MNNDNIIITKSMVTFITIAILLLSSIVSVVAYSVGVKIRTEQSIELIGNCQDRININEKSISKINTDVAVIGTQYTDIIRRLDSIENKIDGK